jgi:ribose 5-phosphate isomerase B
MKIAIGSDHAGFKGKTALVKFLRQAGHTVVDVGTKAEDSVDYPDYARDVAVRVSKKKSDRGVLVCGTGIGMAIAANKVPGIRAAVVWSPETARLASEHNNANILCLSGRLFNAAALKKMLKTWLTTPFQTEGRHQRRLDKISQMEKAR